ncbi:M15 family metallopeptidase [Schumannella soli]|nr:M15 family metallopeptidase [Schumannella soli]
MRPESRAPHPPADALHRLPGAWAPPTAPVSAPSSARPVPARPHLSRATRRARALALALILLVLALVIAAVAIPGVRGALAPTVQRVLPSAPSGGLASGGMWTGSPTAADGYIATGDSVAVDDESVPAVANLDPDLRAAIQAAAAAAVEDGHDLVLTSGWRSERYQQWLFDTAVRHYGSEQEARRWVATPRDSAHVSGSAVDIGPWETTLWMQSHAEEFGLCQIYANEMWHYELAARHGGTCPALREDAAG